MKKSKNNENTVWDGRSIDEIIREEETFFDKLLAPFSRARFRMQQRREERRYRRQRAKKGYSDFDLFEMRYWFTETTKRMLRELSERAYSYPDGITEEEWRELLLEMARLVDIFEPYDDTAVCELLGIRESDMSGHSEEIMKEKNKAKERFFELFNKWFYDL